MQVELGQKPQVELGQQWQIWSRKAGSWSSPATVTNIEGERITMRYPNEQLHYAILSMMYPTLYRLVQDQRDRTDGWPERPGQA